MKMHETITRETCECELYPFCEHGCRESIIPAHITDPRPNPGIDPLYGERMDSADMGEN